MKPSKKIKIALMTIGNELLRGFTLDTNLASIGSELLKNGYEINSAATIRDDKKEIASHLETLLNDKVEIIIATGGLGPTVDDITKESIADCLGLELKENADVKKKISHYFRKKSQVDFPDSIFKQALIPESAEIINNSQGTAPGIFLRHYDKNSTGSTMIFLLPGPPRELKPMFANQVIPLIAKAHEKQTFCKTVIIRNMSESKIELLTSNMFANKDVQVAFCASLDSVKIYISAEQKLVVEKLLPALNFLFKKYILPDTMSTPAEFLLSLMIEHNISLSCAESCTGGLIASAITDLPGASKCFKGSIVSYANEWKTELLKIPNAVIKKFGAVSSECVTRMLKVADLYNTDAAIAVTGIAGPAGGTKDKPVGTVFIAVKYANIVSSKKHFFSGSRENIRLKARNSAINMMLDLILDNTAELNQNDISVKCLREK